MTTEQAKQKLIAWAQAQVGVREGTGNWNKYAENADLVRLYGWAPQNQPWCDVFVDVAFIECFGLELASRMTYQPIGTGSALCRTSAQYYKAEGAFSHIPEPGDQVFFYSSGDINHTGIVVRVYGNTIVTVEGNSSDMVAERTYNVSDSKIAGYGHPKWDVVSTVYAASAETGNYYELRLPYLRHGSMGDAVIAVQFQLAAQGYDIGPDGADGDFGRRTEAAVSEFQGNVGITPDGVVGPETGARLFGGEIYTHTAEFSTTKEQKASSFWDNIVDKIMRND